MFTITKEFHFSASHVLDGLREGHQCGRLHGHNYIVTVELSAEALDPATGFVVDYGELAPLKQLIDDRLDHRHLNDVLWTNPTAELLAKWLFDWCQANEPTWPVSGIGVSETPKTWAWFRP